MQRPAPPARDDDRLVLPERAARRLVAVQALEAADPQGRLVGLAEREQADQEALAATGDPARGQPPDPRAWLQARADRLLGLLAHRQPALAALGEPPAWSTWVAWGLPALALVLGAAIDRIDNPHQVNLLSAPLLALVAWNLLVYVGIAVLAVRPRRGLPTPRPSWLTGLRTPGGARGAVVLAFRRLWAGVGGPLEGQRWRRTLHAAAATWAVGVALSVLGGGLVREYRIGWESTLLDDAQVHAVLRTLYAPVVALLPVEPFTLDEIRRLRFDGGAPPDPQQARRWVWLTVALLALAVVLPRTLLALWAGLRARWAAGRLRLDLGQPYWRELLARVRPARLQLGVASTGPQLQGGLDLLLRQLAVRDPQAALTGAPLLATPQGDELASRRVDPAPGAAPPAAAAGWWRRVPAAAQPTSAAGDDVLLLASDAAAATARLLATLPAGPVLVLAAAGDEQAHARAVREAGRTGEVIAVDRLATWRDDAAWWDALGRLLPAHQQAGLARLRAAALAGAEVREARAMQLLAGELLAAAAEVEPVPTLGALGVRQLVVPGERQAARDARTRAGEALLARLRARQVEGDAQLLALYGIDPREAADASLSPEAALRVHQAVDASQAGLAGAASGAAMGATVDLLAGGLTLGAASALGALVGGGAALAAAAWKNRAGDTGAVRLDDAMLLALAQLALLRYLSVVHTGRARAGESAHWPAVVADLLAQHRADLQAAWRLPHGSQAPAQLAARLQGLAAQAVVRVHSAGAS